jgi:AcrR family transcriptional regulator
MPRPSRNIDQVLLQSGRALYPQLGCAGLSLRLLAEHAGVNVGMFHYHFQSKDNFLRELLAQMYEELFLQLQQEANIAGTTLQRLRQALCRLGRMMREQGDWLGRVLADASHGEAVAMDFLHANGARHVGLLIGLLEQAAREGSLLAPMQPMQRVSFLMGSVVAPMVIAPRAMQLGIVPAPLAAGIQNDVLSDAGIAQRVDYALWALTHKPPFDSPQESPPAKDTLHG